MVATRMGLAAGEALTMGYAGWAVAAVLAIVLISLLAYLGYAVWEGMTHR